MPITLTALATELQNLRYAPLISAGSDQGIADMLNAVDPTIIVPRVISATDVARALGRG